MVPKSRAVPQGGSEASGQFGPPETRVEGGVGGRRRGSSSPSPSPGLGIRQRPPSPALAPAPAACSRRARSSPSSSSGRGVSSHPGVLGYGPTLPPPPGPAGRHRSRRSPWQPAVRGGARWAHSQPVGSLRSGRQGKWARLEAGGWARAGEAGCGLLAAGWAGEREVWGLLEGPGGCRSGSRARAQSGPLPNARPAPLGFSNRETVGDWETSLNPQSDPGAKAELRREAMLRHIPDTLSVEPGPGLVSLPQEGKAWAFGEAGRLGSQPYCHLTVWPRAVTWPVSFLCNSSNPWVAGTT